MLVEFWVSNYRSFREEQVFSLVASKDATLKQHNTIPIGLSAVPCLLRSAVLFGENAGGKTNLVEAMRFMRAFAVGSSAGSRSGETIGVSPFLLDDGYGGKPSCFGMTFIVSGIRFRYNLSVTRERVIAESLLAYKAFKPQAWYSRRYDRNLGHDVYTFSGAFRGEKKTLSQATPPNASFLSVAVQNGNAMLKPVYEWFSETLVIPAENDACGQALLPDRPRERRAIAGLLNAFDARVEDVRLSGPAGPDGNRDIVFCYGTARGKCELPLGEVSAGTRRLFWLAVLILKAVEGEKVLVIDDLDLHLHPLTVREVVRYFYGRQEKAQLAATSHEASLLDAVGLFRRDQIWFAEKGTDMATELVGLLEYRPRKNEALARGYLSGRYGAIPFLENERPHEAGAGD